MTGMDENKTLGKVLQGPSGSSDSGVGDCSGLCRAAQTLHLVVGTSRKHRLLYAATLCPWPGWRLPNPH